MMSLGQEGHSSYYSGPSVCFTEVANETLNPVRVNTQ